MIGKVSIHFIMLALLLIVLLVEYSIYGGIYFDSIIIVLVGFIVVARLDMKIKNRREL